MFMKENKKIWTTSFLLTGNVYWSNSFFGLLIWLSSIYVKDFGQKQNSDNLHNANILENGNKIFCFMSHI